MKRKTKKRKSHSKGLSSPAPKRRRRSGLSEVMSGANLKNSAINTGLGMLGGAASTIGNKLIQGFKPGIIGTILIGGGIGFIASSLGAPKLGIGYAGGSTALALNGKLSDNGEFAEEDTLEEGEIYQTESGDYVRMLSDGEIEYLSEDEVEALNDNVYPDYSTQQNM